jgi:hypothetical protein
VQTTDACFRVRVSVTTNYGESGLVPDGVPGARDRRGSEGTLVGIGRLHARFRPGDVRVFVRSVSCQNGDFGLGQPVVSL